MRCRHDEGRGGDVLVEGGVGPVAPLCELERVGHRARGLAVEEGEQEERRARRREKGGCRPPARGAEV